MEACLVVVALLGVYVYGCSGAALLANDTQAPKTVACQGGACGQYR